MDWYRAIEILNQLSQPVLAFFTIGLVFATILLWRSTKRYAKSTEQMSKTMEGQKDIIERQTAIMEDQTKIMASQSNISDKEARWGRFVWLGEKYVNGIVDLQKSNYEKNEDTVLIELGLIGIHKYLESEISHLVKTFEFELKEEEEKEEIINELLSRGYTMENIIKAREILLKKQSSKGGNATK